MIKSNVLLSLLFIHAAATAQDTTTTAGKDTLSLPVATPSQKPTTPLPASAHSSKKQKNTQ
ncbi:hypothetical protein ACQ86N_35010 [Puia sp. P3]|uniref:hypothetical protein n=1 Tax=Puia sp. P3 TaxID=3423952 RepID=UPI003D664866